MEQLLQNIIEDTIGDGIKITDAELKDEEVPEKKELNLCGVKDLEDEERMVMIKLRPETALYSDLNIIEIESDIEATLCKLRWTEMEKDEEYEEVEIIDRAEHSDRSNIDFIEIVSRLVWNESDNSIDMGRVKSTDMRGNKRIKLPPPLDPKREGLIQTRASLWRRIMVTYKNEFCTGKDKHKQKQTMDPKLLVGIDKLKKIAGLSLLQV